MPRTMAGAATLKLNTLCGERSLDIDAVIEDLVIAGWTGRDRAAMEAHIRELEAIGVPRPATTPTFYRVGANLLTTRPCIDVCGKDSSGEVEAVLISLDQDLWIGVGSDHTDRRAERYQVTLSKQACPKPIGATVWAFEELAGHWDELVLRAFAITAGERVLYQEGQAGIMRPPDELARMYCGNGARLPAGTAMFCGTLPVRGAVRPAERFEIEIEDPVMNRKLRHSYAVRALPIAG